jgi:L-ascorbate metabolism protein UlaG (beta-lactamase superfamily)
MEPPFLYGSPILPRPGRLDIRLPFASEIWDALFAARTEPVDVQELAARFDLDLQALTLFTSLFTDAAPAPHDTVEPGFVRTRYFGHASVLVETSSGAVLLDPLIGYEGDGGPDHFTIADLPPKIDAVVISHAHADHFSLEALLQLRGRTTNFIVPRSSGGSLQDPSLKTMLQALGFHNVHELGELESLQVSHDMEVVALPFVGEHADLDIRTKTVPMVRAAGRTLLFATDVALPDPAFYDGLTDVVGEVDALFIGLECVGAPLSWLYGPLLKGRLTYQQNQGRRMIGSDAAMADALARQTRARRVFIYAMGLESWLKHRTGGEFDAESEQIRQGQLLTKICEDRGIGAELLYQKAEFRWPATDRP